MDVNQLSAKAMKLKRKGFNRYYKFIELDIHK
ncbi:MAG: hypothetical protein JWQ84_1341 [Mucilaginibacter sp.]|nr:hypothetical protein [Mucilaginibacter sp.]